MKDQRLHLQAEAVEAIWYVCRDVQKDGEVEKPSPFAAFPGPDWMREHLRYEQWMALYNLYYATCEKFSTAPRISPETMAMIRPFLVDNDNIEARLAGYERQEVINLAAHYAWQADKADKACDAALQQRDEAEAKLEAAERRLEELEAQLAEANPAPAD